jgi:hypothetical protein
MAGRASIMELHAMLVDACKAYDEDIQAAEKPQLKALFEKAKSLHETAQAEVHAILSARAANPDYEASFLKPVHKVAAISSRAAGMGLDERSLSSVFGKGGSLRPTIMRSMQTTMTARSATFCSDKSLCSSSLRANCKGRPCLRIVKCNFILTTFR